MSRRVGRVNLRRAAMRRNEREAKRGSLRPRATPSDFSMSHRAGPFRIAQFARGAAMLPNQLKRSTRDIAQSLVSNPLVLTYDPLPSIISRGISTLAGHSKRHMWQLTHKSATDLKSSWLNVESGNW